MVKAGNHNGHGRMPNTNFLSDMNNLLISMIILLSAAPTPAQIQGIKPTAPQPNIVFIILDAARADHFGCYGYDRPTTPGIDNLAKNGVIFLNNFSPAMETFNSMPLIMSSRYYSKEIFQKDDWRWGIRRESTRTIFTDFDPEQIFLPDLLSLNGYRTAIIHDHWWFVPQTDFVQSFDQAVQVKTEQPTDDAILAAAKDWIEKNRDLPFFLYLHIMSPHQPYPAKPEDEEFLGDLDPTFVAQVIRKFENKPNESCTGWTQEEIECLKRLYDGNLRHTDTRIGRLYATLQQWNLANNTIVIITSDHGEHLGEHNHLNHGGPPFDSVIHVPLIMVWPRGLPRGIKVEGLTESVDIMPTIIDLCSLRVPDGKTMDGVSLLPYIRSPQTGKDAVYTDESIRTQIYKYRFDEDGSILFNIILDPGEMTSIKEEYPKVSASLQKQHDTAMSHSRQRYQNARKSAPPNYPFYLPLREFHLAPEESFQLIGISQDPAPAIKEIIQKKSWVLNTETHRGGLFWLPGPPPSPLEISIGLPDGLYRVAALVETLEGEKGGNSPPGLMARFPGQESFRAPRAVEKLPEDRFRYLDWGTFEVKNNRFKVELKGRPGMNIPIYIHHLRFEPVGKAESGTNHQMDIDTHRKQREGLKSLGYL